jgi:anti-sigma28 factor (negative regulator of flagellin synthesis)
MQMFPSPGPPLSRSVPGPPTTHDADEDDGDAAAERQGELPRRCVEPALAAHRGRPRGDRREGGVSVGRFTHLGPRVVVTSQYGDAGGLMLTPTPTVKTAPVAIGLDSGSVTSQAAVTAVGQVKGPQTASRTSGDDADVTVNVSSRAQALHDAVPASDAKVASLSAALAGGTLKLDSQAIAGRLVEGDGT